MTHLSITLPPSCLLRRCSTFADMMLSAATAIVVGKYPLWLMLHVSAVAFVGSAAAADTWGSTLFHELGVLLCCGNTSCAYATFLKVWALLFGRQPAYFRALLCAVFCRSPSQRAVRRLINPSASSTEFWGGGGAIADTLNIGEDG